MKPSVIRWCLSIALVVLVVVGNNNGVDAWGRDGHRITARIAQAFMTPRAISQVSKQLQPGVTIAQLANLPDEYRASPGGDWSFRLHFVNLPANATEYLASACLEPPGCVVSAISNYTDILFANRGNITDNCSNNSTIEPCALSFLIHFVGDCHQPMHVSYESDQGGNAFKCGFYGQPTELHGVWDTSMIVKYESEKDYEWEQFADELIAELKQNPQAVSAYEAIKSPPTWANESFSYVRNVCYNFMPGTAPIPTPTVNNTQQQPQHHASHEHMNLREFWERVKDDYSGIHHHQVDHSDECTGPNIGDLYYNRNIDIVKRRLSAGGIRLATTLNGIYA